MNHQLQGGNQAPKHGAVLPSSATALGAPLQALLREWLQLKGTLKVITALPTTPSGCLGPHAFTLAEVFAAMEWIIWVCQENSSVFFFFSIENCLVIKIEGGWGGWRDTKCQGNGCCLALKPGLKAASPWAVSTDRNQLVTHHRKASSQAQHTHRADRLIIIARLTGSSPLLSSQS